MGWMWAGIDYGEDKASADAARAQDAQGNLYTTGGASGYPIYTGGGGGAPVPGVSGGGGGASGGVVWIVCRTFAGSFAINVNGGNGGNGGSNGGSGGGGGGGGAGGHGGIAVVHYVTKSWTGAFSATGGTGGTGDPGGSGADGVAGANGTAGAMFEVAIS